MTYLYVDGNGVTHYRTITVGTPVNLVKSDDVLRLAAINNSWRARKARESVRIERVELTGRRAGSRRDRRVAISNGWLPPVISYGPH